MPSILTTGVCCTLHYLCLYGDFRRFLTGVDDPYISVERIIRASNPSQSRVAQDATVGQLEPFLTLDDANTLLSNLAESLHRTGLNIRLLGLVRHNCKLPISKSL